MIYLYLLNNYILKFNDTGQFDNLVISFRQTFVSGKYSLFKNIKINIQLITNDAI